VRAYERVRERRFVGAFEDAAAAAAEDYVPGRVGDVRREGSGREGGEAGFEGGRGGHRGVLCGIWETSVGASAGERGDKHVWWILGTCMMVAAR
jgi:hypothetical protein